MRRPEAVDERDAPAGAPASPSPGAAALEVIEWLSGDACHDLDDAGLVAGLGRRLREAGLPIDRLSLHLRTLHPEILGRSIVWAPGEPVEIADREHGVETSASFVGSALQRVMATGEPVVTRPGATGAPAWTMPGVFRDRGLAELVIVPLSNTDGPVSAAAFCTARRTGFTAAERAALERIVPALRNACELRTLRQVELTLLDTYIGRATAQRILAGRIRRGQVETLEAALLLCDLRGFTALSNRLAGGAVLGLLDGYFDKVVPAIAAAGGEVLKFMGDAVLAFVQRDEAADACAAALAAARDALARLDALPGRRLKAGIALHYGKASYGNIGSGRRLDFTVIGPDVNLLSRIQGVCSTTAEPLLMSESFADLLGEGATVSKGRHALKGFARPLELHAPA